MQEAVQDRLDEFVDNRLPGGRLGSEEWSTRSATIPTIIATVECAGRSGWFDRIPRRRMPSALIWPRRAQRPSDIGDAGTFDLVVAEAIGCDERQQQALVLDQDVVEVSDELPRQLLFVGLFGDDGLPCLTEVVDEVRERQTRASRNKTGLRAEVAEEQVFADAGGLGDLAGGGAAVILAGEQFTGGVEQQRARLAA